MKKMLDKILKYMEDNCYDYYDTEMGICEEKVVAYEELKDFIEQLKKECEQYE